MVKWSNKFKQYPRILLVESEVCGGREPGD